jgi:hypothetical protein
LVTSGNDLWGRAHVLTLQGYEAFRAVDLDLAKDLHSTAHGLAVELGDRAAQAENLLALAHIHLVRDESNDAARVLTQAKAGRALLDDVARRFLNLDKAAMGTAYALSLADVYRRAGRPVLAAALLRHALSLLDETKSPEKFAQVRQQLSAVEDGLLDEAGPRP